jgi:hypothetical protein
MLAGFAFSSVGAADARFGVIRGDLRGRGEPCQCLLALAPNGTALSSRDRLRRSFALRPGLWPNRRTGRRGRAGQAGVGSRPHLPSRGPLSFGVGASWQQIASEILRVKLAQLFAVLLALGLLIEEEVAAGVVVADLGDGHHVDRVVELPVALRVEPLSSGGILRQGQRPDPVNLHNGEKPMSGPPRAGPGVGRPGLLQVRLTLVEWIMPRLRRPRGRAAAG